MQFNAYVSAVDLELAELRQHLRGSLTHLVWQLAQLPGHELIPVYVGDDPTEDSGRGITWRRRDRMAYQ